MLFSTRFIWLSTAVLLASVTAVPFEEVGRRAPTRSVSSRVAPSKSASSRVDPSRSASSRSASPRPSSSRPAPSRTVSSRVANATSTVVERQSNSEVTVTSTTVTSVVSTSTILTSTLCASFINASTACRRRRDGWIDRPIILALDEQFDELAERHLDPSYTVSVETSRRPRLTDIASETEIESSQEDTTDRPVDDAFRIAEPVYFSQLAAIFPIFSGLFGLSSTVTETSTSTRTVTSFTISTTSTVPIIFSGCSPAAAAQYSTCVASG